MAKKQISQESTVTLDTPVTTEESISKPERQLIEFCVNINDFGGVGDGQTNDSIALQNSINYLSEQNGGTVLLTGIHLINGTINIPSNITIKGKNDNVTLKSTSPQALFKILDYSENVGIKNLIFDYENNNSNIAIQVLENVKNLRLNTLTFRNFHNNNSEEMLEILQLRTGITGNISDLTFKNITTVGNGIIGENSGAGRCIRTVAWKDVEYQNYNLNIQNVLIEDCYNTKNGKPIIEDFDPIVFQHFDSVGGVINLSNVTARNFNKRLIKIQGDGVNISNITAESETPISCLIAVMGKNINISNVIAKGNINQVLEFLNAKNVNVSNIQVDSSFEGNHVTDVLFYFTNTENINISKVTGNGNGGFLIYGKIAKNIFISDISLELKSHALYIEDRDVANSIYTGGTISNICFSNISLSLPNATYTGPCMEITQNTTNQIKNIYFNNFQLSVNPTYLWGVLRLKNIENVNIENIFFENLSSSNDIELIKISGISDVIFKNLHFDGKEVATELVQLDNSNVLITHSKHVNLYISGTGSTTELEKAQAKISYNGGATLNQIKNS